MALNGETLGQAIFDVCKGEIPESSYAPALEWYTAFASAIVAHLKDNAEITVPVSTGGLQRDPATSEPTLAPAAPVNLAGQIG